jgi:hypothetical protein
MPSAFDRRSTFDRLLGNRHLYAEREPLHREMARWLLRGQPPVIVIDWADLKADKSWCLLRAAVPVGGRTLTLLDMIFPGKEQGSPTAEKRFLQRLQALVPEGVRPILVTDVGFRTPWLRAVSALGWHWLGRLRGRTRVKPLAEEDHADQWVDCRQLHALATQTPQELPLMQINRSDPITCRLVLYAKARQGRQHRNRRCRTEVARSSSRRKATRAVVDHRIAPPASASCPAVGEPIRPQDANRTVLPRPEVSSLWPRVRRQPDTQRCTPADIAAGRHAGVLRQLVGGSGLRSDRHRPMADADPLQTEAVFNHARGTRSAGQTLADRARLPWLDRLRSLPHTVLVQMAIAT